MRRQIAVVMVATLVALSLSHCGQSKKSEGSQQNTSVQKGAHAPSDGLSLEQQKVRDETKKRIDEGYAFKREGENGKALEIFKKVNKELSKHKSVFQKEIASILDDQATIYLRTGNFSKAKALYDQALFILMSEKLSKDRLALGIERRLATMDALTARNMKCSEPLSFSEKGAQGTDSGEKVADAGVGTEKLPYFPDKETLFLALAKLRDDLTPCINESLLYKPLPVWMVITGDGRIVLSRAKDRAKGTKAGKCLEEKIEQAALKHRKELPRFRACFRNTSYPFLFTK